MQGQEAEQSIASPVVYTESSSANRPVLLSHPSVKSSYIVAIIEKLELGVVKNFKRLSSYGSLEYRKLTFQNQ